ncbi:MAG: hypothetical protein NZ872_04945 [Archaeoglobaceae archaeon]|nr:hypothetical protein [Archaeoglobaceae archaeon]MDW8128546.1 hypothetical protein [Archaeoglobaceae archaeon]
MKSNRKVKMKPRAVKLNLLLATKSHRARISRVKKKSIKEARAKLSKAESIAKANAEVDKKRKERMIPIRSLLEIFIKAHPQ